MPDVRITELRLRRSPADVFDALAPAADHLVFLDSALSGGRLGRWSILAAAPFLILRTRGRRIEWRRAGRWHTETGNPFQALRAALQAHRLPRDPACPLPFTGGAIGYLAYDLGRFVERLPDTAADDLALPELYLGFYDCALVHDHDAGAWWRIGPSQGPFADLSRTVPPARPGPPACAAARVASNFSRPEYLRAVRRAIDYIAAGDIFQVNLSQRFHAPWPHGPVALYGRLRTLNPAPFAAYLGFEDLAVASSSPERFLRVRDGWVETRPIKGTRPRGATPAEDRALRAELLASEKDRAELTMIVDLERNDLGRVCRYGTVRVAEPVTLETYRTVHHLVATVVGRLHPHYDLVDLLKAAFPGGSITGAPKIRAMEIIDELEPTRRSVYTGAIGYIGFDGSADLNIAIRTIIHTRGVAYYQAGGGIVADSDPELEYEETLHKARAFEWLIGGAFPAADDPADLLRHMTR